MDNPPSYPVMAESRKETKMRLLYTLFVCLSLMFVSLVIVKTQRFAEQIKRDKQVMKVDKFKACLSELESMRQFGRSMTCTQSLCTVSYDKELASKIDECSELQDRLESR